MPLATSTAARTNNTPAVHVLDRAAAGPATALLHRKPLGGRLMSIRTTKLDTAAQVRWEVTSSISSNMGGPDTSPGSLRGERRGARSLAGNLRTAAGLGDLDALAGFFDGDQLRDDAGSARAFYRPHDGFPAWEPGDETQEILDEAFIYAVQNGRLAAAEMLLARGAHVDGAPYTGTAMHRVAHRGPYDALCFLLDRGADPNATWNVPKGSTPLHLAALQGRLASVRALLDHGGDPDATDSAFSTTPRGYAEWAGQDHIVALFAERD